ncbi:Histidinol-phosphate aminotransferase [Buchnera aphidicola (Thelaxes suberi)]|uniref:histidinol-phosphate transaminase n=1 Tax=Buchnera aphidicola TaxID=9 RepID=UPI003463E28A
MFDITQLAKKNIQQLKPYQSARRIGGAGSIWMNANELPYEINYISQNIKLNRYPDNQPSNVVKKYANYAGVSYNNVIVTRGADEGIELLIKAFCNSEHDAIITCPPTYPMYAISAEIMGIKNYEIATFYNWNLDLQKIYKYRKNTKIIYICRPNNPTGYLINEQDIYYLLDLFKNTALVVVDEAYIEFSMNYNLSKLIPLFPNLVILRTLSKAFGLAALRCGFILANCSVINLLKNIIAPYPIPTPISDIASHFLNEDMIINMKNRVKKINVLKKWFLEKLKNIKVIKNIFDSQGNFLLIEFFCYKSVCKKLYDKGIIIRSQNDKIMLKNHVRISIGTHKDCAQILDILKKL